MTTADTRTASDVWLGLAAMNVKHARGAEIERFGARMRDDASDWIERAPQRLWSDAVFHLLMGLLEHPLPPKPATCECCKRPM